MGHDLRTGLDEGDVNVKYVEEREEEADANDPNEQVGECPDGDTVLARDHGSAAAIYARNGGGTTACVGCHEMPPLFRSQPEARANSLNAYVGARQRFSTPMSVRNNGSQRLCQC